MDSPDESTTEKILKPLAEPIPITQHKIEIQLLKNNLLKNTKEELRIVQEEKIFEVAMGSLEETEEVVDVPELDLVNSALATRMMEQTREYKNLRNKGISSFVESMNSKQFKEIVINAMPLHAESFCHTNSDSTMISYYDTGKYYKPHIDSTHFTCLIWLFKEPKQFKGGDLKLIPAKETIECV